MAKDVARLTLEPGTRFGRYEVVTEIASGGMATVFLARALGAAGFQRLVAIKLMHPHYAKDEEFVTMFMDEARLAARIRHPNVVATLDLENDEDGLYLVMEYIEGDGLLGIFKAASKTNKLFPAPIAVRIMLDVLNGLQAAHELTGDRGEPLRLVHRDISPHNVLLGVDGIARITDFGIARAEERMGATRDGQIKGKLAYMAPEQTSANPVDCRADLFAAGVVLWECLAGKRLLHGQNDGEVLRNLLVNPIPRLKDVKPELGAALDEVCAKALERDPEKRFSTAAQFGEALEEAAGAIGIGSARAVAKHVREVSGKSIMAMQLRVQGLLPADMNRESKSGVRRRRESTDPENTIRRDELSDPSLAALGSDPSMSQKHPPVPVPPVGTGRVGASAFAIDNSLTPDLLVDDETRPKSKRGLVIALAAIGCIVIGGSFVALRSGSSPATAASGIVAPSTTQVPLVTAASPTVPAAAAEPSAVAADPAPAAPAVHEPTPVAAANPGARAAAPAAASEPVRATERVHRRGAAPAPRERPAAPAGQPAAPPPSRGRFDPEAI